MPSPFPGMDPFLENPGLWPDVHHELISEARALLVAQLGPNYFVRIEERVYISDENDTGRGVIIPDIQIMARPGWEGRSPAAQPGAVDLIEPFVADLLIDQEIRESRLEIVDGRSRRVVTVIEVVSPSNKVAGSRGRESFHAKRSDVAESASHWVEIDLLRGGERVSTLQRLPAHDYLALILRAGQRPRSTIWPIRLPQPLPTIPIPLKPDDPDASLDLQAVLTTAYHRAGYGFSVDYTREPVPPLDPEWAQWADALLRDKGVRPR